LNRAFRLYVCKTNKYNNYSFSTPLIWCLQAQDQGSTVDLFLFSRLKSIMKDARFADVATVQERVTAVLRYIIKETFADSFQKLYELCQKCVVKEGDYFEEQ
jgi:hypothetical protein